MSTTQHTPGPWHVDAMGNVWAKRTKICDKPTQAEIYREKTFIEQKSNFALIAAAPELLEACKAFIAYEESEKESNYIQSMFLYSKAVTKARAAIAKAEGNI